MPDHTLQEGELILYRTAGDAVRIEVLYESESFWLDQRRMAELFGVDVRTINYHLKEATPRESWRQRQLSEKFGEYNRREIARSGGRSSSTTSTRSSRSATGSTALRQLNSASWATQTLREFIVKGFVLDDERLKLNKRFGRDYFDEPLLPRGWHLH